MPLSSEVEANLRLVLSTREQINGEHAAALIRAIHEYVDEYQWQKASEADPGLQAVQAWLYEVTDRIDRLDQWITEGPHCGCGHALEREPPLCACREKLNLELLDQLAGKRLEALRALLNFRVSFQWFVDKKPAHRPEDYRRAMLEESVGDALAAAGVRLTTAEDGTYGRILNQIYADVGIATGAATAIRKVLGVHPDWRTLRKAPLDSR